MTSYTQKTMEIKQPNIVAPSPAQPIGRKKGKIVRQTSEALNETHRQKSVQNPIDKYPSLEIYDHKAYKTSTNLKSKKTPSTGLKQVPAAQPKPNDKKDQKQSDDDKLPSQRSIKPNSDLMQTNDSKAARHKKEHTKMIQDYPMGKLLAFMVKHGLEDSLNYTILSNDIFVKQIGDFYYCVLCCKRSRLQNPKSIDGHLESKQHMESFSKLRDRIRLTIPKDESIQSIALEMLLNTWIRASLLDEADREKRTIAISEFSNILIDVAPECKYRVIGSFLTGISHRGSDVNLELLHPNSKLFESDPGAKDSIHHKLVDPDAEYGSQFNNHVLHYDLIGNAVACLHRIALFLSGENTNFYVLSDILDLNAKVPELALTHMPTQTILRICCHAESNYKLNCLLRNYLLLDKRALDLCILIKFWARLCRIEDPKSGTFSSDALAILVIHYLQKTEPPVLPCLHDLLRKRSKSKNEEAIRSAAQLENMISSLKIDQATSNCHQRAVPGNLALKDMNNYVESVDLAEKESLDGEGDDDDDEEEEDDQICNEFDVALIEELAWYSNNRDSVRKLFINFLKSTMDELSDVSKVISIRTLKPVTIQSKRWNTQVKAIENPVRPKTNLTRTIGSLKTFSYILKCFSYAFYYLTSIPQPHLQDKNPGQFGKLYINLKKLDFYFNMKESQIKKSSKSDTISEMIQQDLFARDIEAIDTLIANFITNNLSLELIPNTVFKTYQDRHLVPRDFDATTFCWFCKKHGHIKETCSERVIDRELNTSFDYMLDRSINFDRGFKELYVQDMMTPEMVHDHNRVVRTLEELIRNRLKLDVTLTLFGSTVNLLGSHDSDLDICMTITGNLTGRDVDCVSILEQVSELLKMDSNVKDLEPILAARVPIVRLNYMGFEIDLCMYNQCAIHNSRLLKSYVMLNFKVAQLFYLVKRYAKGCGIADASIGSLSSYAWSLLVIHFMQNTNPPMLPVLQEKPNNKPRQVLGVGGWDVWFNEDLGSYAIVHRDCTLTSLFKEFLIYYTNFNFNQRVVSIRTNRVITKYQKNWHNCMIAIEDPFQLTYNLSGRLDDQMATYILQSFPRAYQNLCRVQNSCFSQKNPYPPLHIVKTIFQGSSIMDHPPPYRGCRFCHKIGHRVADCPNKVRKQQRKSKESHKEKNIEKEKGMSQSPRPNVRKDIEDVGSKFIS